MIDNDKPQNDAANEDVEAELKGVPEEFLSDDDSDAEAEEGDDLSESARGAAP